MKGLHECRKHLGSTAAQVAGGSARLPVSATSTVTTRKVCELAACPPSLTVRRCACNELCNTWVCAVELSVLPAVDVHLGAYIGGCAVAQHSVSPQRALQNSMTKEAA